jgi:hypothetical protein
MGTGKNPNSRFFQESDENFFDSKHVLMVYFKPRTENPDFGFLLVPILPFSVKIGHLSKAGLSRRSP